MTASRVPGRHTGVQWCWGYTLNWQSHLLILLLMPVLHEIPGNEVVNEITKETVHLLDAYRPVAFYPHISTSSWKRWLTPTSATRRPLLESWQSSAWKPSSSPTPTLKLRAYQLNLNAKPQCSEDDQRLLPTAFHLQGRTVQLTLHRPIPKDTMVSTRTTINLYDPGSSALPDSSQYGLRDRSDKTFLSDHS